MNTGIIILIVVIVLIILVAGYFVKTYNSLIKLRNRVKDSWSQIEVQLKRRFDLIPNIVETVKGYAKHESDTLKGVIEARNKFGVATTPEEEMNANNQLTAAMKSLFAISESYPELKADKNFMSLQENLTETENKIAITRQFYNDTVLTLNNKIEMFPSNIVASMFKFKKEAFFETSEKEKENIKVEF